MEVMLLAVPRIINLNSGVVLVLKVLLIEELDLLGHDLLNVSTF